MRLTRAMKDSLYNIIKNKTTPPYTSDIEKEFKKEIQDLIFKDHPIFKQYIDTYGVNPSFSELLYFKNYGKHEAEINFYINVPAAYGSSKLYYFLKPENLHLQDNYNTRIHNITKDTLELFKDEYAEIFAKVLDKREELATYWKTMNELEDIINTFTTDNALAQAYPEFEQFFLQAGITNKPKKKLPSVTGLPKSLENYGVKLSPDVDTLAEEIKKEMKEDE